MSFSPHKTIALCALLPLTLSQVGAQELPDWKGGARPDGYRLGGELWPAGSVPKDDEAPPPLAEEGVAATGAAINNNTGGEPGDEPVAAPRPDPSTVGGNVIAMAPPGEAGLRPLTGLRLPMPVMMPLPAMETFTHELPPVTGELRDEYFSLRPAEYLVDPQRLLTEQKSHDVQRFLEYHADEAQYDICLMLFGANQDIPADVSLDERHRQWFGDEHVVLVAYFLEHPEKTRVIYGDEPRKKLPSVVFDRIFQSCVREAQVASTPFDQVERLSIELSIRLYWMSKLIERQTAGEVIATTQETLSEPDWKELAADAQKAVMLTSSGSPSRAATVVRKLGGLPWLGMGIGTFVLSCTLGAGAWWWRRDSLAAKPVLFPEIDLPTRLGGAYSGGGFVGISFEVSGKSEK